MSSFYKSIKNNVIFSSNSNLLIFPEIISEVPIILKPSTLNCNTSEKGEKENELNSEKKLKENEQKITCGNFSSQGNFFAVIDEAKQLYLWNTNQNTFSLLSIRKVCRKCVKLKFTHSEDAVLIADRSGDVYSFSVTDPDQSGKLLLGHLSMLLDLIITPDDKFIITCDRDEKIRVSCFPNCYNIHSYCLGHKKFVSCLSIFPSYPELLISGSGDGTFMIWNYKDGLCLYDRNYENDFIEKNLLRNEDNIIVPNDNESNVCEPHLKNEKYLNCAVKQVECSNKNNIIAALFDRFSYIVVYNYNYNPDKNNFSIIQVQFLQYSAEPWKIHFCEENLLWILLPIKDNILNILHPVINNQSLKFETNDDTNKFSSLMNLVNKNWDFFAGINSINLFLYYNIFIMINHIAFSFRISSDTK